MLLFVKYMLMYLTYSNLNSIHWLIKNKKNVLFRTFSGHFMTIFRSNYFHLKLSFFNFFLNIRYIYANVFKIFKFELNSLENKKDISLYVLFRTFQVNFQDISVTQDWTLYIQIGHRNTEKTQRATRRCYLLFCATIYN